MSIVGPHLFFEQLSIEVLASVASELETQAPPGQGRTVIVPTRLRARGRLLGPGITPVRIEVWPVDPSAPATEAAFDPAAQTVTVSFSPKLRTTFVDPPGEDRPSEARPAALVLVVDAPVLNPRGLDNPLPTSPGTFTDVFSLEGGPMATRCYFPLVMPSRLDTDFGPVNNGTTWVVHGDFLNAAKTNDGFHGAISDPNYPTFLIVGPILLDDDSRFPVWMAFTQLNHSGGAPAPATTVTHLYRFYAERGPAELRPLVPISALIVTLP